MKNLSDYISESQTMLFDQTKSFFAFGNDQLNEKIEKKVTYVRLGGGLFTPKENVRTLVDGLSVILKIGIEKDVSENGIFNIIKRELNNYECFYTGEISDCVDALAEYPISREQIFNVFRYNKL